MERTIISSSNQSEHKFDIVVSNLSVNLYSKSFGRKFIELASGNTFHCTEGLHGSHLLWVGKGYLFRRSTSCHYINFCLKS
jgi:hypothetical protein